MLKNTLRSVREKNRESIRSIMPIAMTVLVVSIIAAPVGNGILALFLFGTLFLILGMGLFTLGSGLFMEPLGEGLGVAMSRSRKLWLCLAGGLALGSIVTLAEPDLAVLAEQVRTIPNALLIGAVALGVGLFLMLALARSAFGWKLRRLLWIGYTLLFIGAAFCSAEALPATFDAGGVTTGPMTVPFIMALGAGFASVRNDRNSGEDSFGLIALCSIGPILSVMILSFIFSGEPSGEVMVIPEVTNTREAFNAFVYATPRYAKDLALALSPLVVLFIAFESITRRWHWRTAIRMVMGILYTYGGLVLFLTGANVGFMPAGKHLGAELASGGMSWLLIPVGMIMGFFIVSAEPAVHVLKRQVEEISSGAITQNAVGSALAVGVAVSVGLSMARVMTCVSLLPFLLVGYSVALIISFFVPGLYTGVAFDSGGVASGPMTTTFLLPFAVGASEALGGNPMADAFGIVAMVAMTPLITIQTLGLVSRIRTKVHHRKMSEELALVPDGIRYYEEEKHG